MDYQRASLIRGTSLSGLIGERYSSGQGFGGAIRGAISDKFKAKAVSIKEKLDPLNLVRKVTGQGAIGNIATAIAGRAMGRSQRDIAYFGGYTRRRSTIPSLQSGGQDGTATSVRNRDSELLEKIYNFLKNSFEQRKRVQQIDRSFRNEQLSEDERRHKDLLRVILSSGGETAVKPQKESSDIFNIIETLKKWVTDQIEKFKSFIGDFVEKFLESKLGNLLLTKPLDWLKSLLPSVFGVPFLIASGIAAVLGASLIGVGYKFVSGIREAGGEKAAELAGEDISEMALGAADGDAAVLQAVSQRAMGKKSKQELILEEIEKKQNAIASILEPAGYKAVYRDKDIFVFENDEGKKPSNELIMAAGAQADYMLSKGEPIAIKIPMSKIPTKEEWEKRKREVKNLGTQTLTPSTQETTAQETFAPAAGRGTVAGPTAAEMSTLAAGGGRGAAAGPTAAEMENAPAPTASPTSAAGSSTSPVTAGVTGAAAATMSAGGGRGTMAGPTAEEMRLAPTPALTPVPKVIPEITPTPEMPSISSMAQEPMIQSNTNTNVFGGKKDRVLATSTPKQRNTDLNRYLSNGFVAV